MLEGGALLPAASALALASEPAVASAGGSCCTGRGGVCARDDEASLDRMGGGVVAPGGVTVTPGVELLAAGLSESGADEVAADVEARDDEVPRVDDALTSFGRCTSVGGDLSQLDLPLEATLGGSWQ